MERITIHIIIEEIDDKELLELKKAIEDLLEGVGRYALDVSIRRTPTPLVTPPS